MQNLYNSPSSPYRNKFQAYDAPLSPKLQALQQQLPWQSEDRTDFNKPFSVNYIAKEVSPYKVYSQQNQALVNSVLDRANRGKGVRSYLLNENYTEREMLQGIRTLTRLFDTNLNAIHRKIGILSPNTVPNIPKRGEYTDTNALLASHFKGENFPERQIVRSLSHFVQMADSHFESLHHSLGQLQRHVDQLKGAQSSPLYAAPEHDEWIAATLLQRKMENTSRSNLYSRFIPQNEIYPELKGLQMMKLTGEFLITNMEYLHYWMERLQKQVGVPDLPAAAKPKNEAYAEKLRKISNDGKYNPVNLLDENSVDRRLLDMLQPLTHIVADNVEYLQKRLSGSLGPKIWHLMQR
jgi:hypothetical protein